MKTGKQMHSPKTLNVCALASGSKGNSLLIEGPEGSLLVDAGLSAREIIRRVQAVGGTPEAIRGVLVTHDHSDHVRGVRVLARRLSVPVYGTRGTLDGVGFLDGACATAIAAGCGFDAAGFGVSPFSLPHDASDPVGFIVSMGNLRIGVATDLGCVTALVRKRLAGCDFLLIESNHDEKMLMEGSYPWFLKQRIRSRTGHLSNSTSSGLLSELLHGGLQGVVLGHLSEMNNRPDLALGAAGEAVERGRSGVAVHVAGMAEPTAVFRLEL